MAELDEKIKFLEIAEQLLARKNQIVQVQNSISTLLDDFKKNWENDGPQALRFVFLILSEWGVRLTVALPFLPKIPKPYIGSELLSYFYYIV